MMKRLLDFRYMIVLLSLVAGMVAIACSEEEEPAPAPAPTTAPAPAPTTAPAPAPTAAPAPAPTAAPAPAMMDEGPIYGGTFTSITTREPSSWDPRVGGCDIPHFVYDDLGMGDWSVPREEFSYTGFYIPEQ